MKRLVIHPAILFFFIAFLQLVSQPALQAAPGDFIL
jgi:hypothetical protein